MNTYVLKDPFYTSDSSRTDNFTHQWTKYCPRVKLSMYQNKFSPDDIIIANLYKGNSLSKYDIPSECSKIAIIHSVNEDTIKYINEFDVIIYINELQKDAVQNITGIKRKCLVAPRHPMFEFNTTVNQENTVYIGGWFFPERMTNFFDKLVDLHRKVPMGMDFGIFPVSGSIGHLNMGIEQLYKQIQEESTNKFRGRKIGIAKNELFHDIMLLKTRVCKSAFLWDESPTIEHIKDLIYSNDESVLTYSIEESPTLATLQSSPTNLMVEDHIKFLPYFEKKENFTYRQFSQMVIEAIKIIQ